MHHLGPDARVEAADALGGRQVRGLREEGAWIVGRQGAGPWDGRVEGVRQGLLLDDRAANLAGMVGVRMLWARFEVDQVENKWI